MQNISNKLKYFLLSLIFLLSFATQIQAATLSFAPSNKSYSLNDDFSVNVYVSSQDQSINAASGRIAFPTDKLEVIGLSKSGSIFSLWAQDPSFSNQGGVIDFEGIVMNPGFKGSSGKILSIKFHAKKDGDANLKFSSGSILANDGKGTNVFSGAKSAKFVFEKVTEKITEAVKTKEAIAAPPTPITKAEEKPTTEVIVPSPEAVTITSVSHSDQNKWYTSHDAEFSWDLPKNTVTVSMGTSQKLEDIKLTESATPVSYKKIMGLGDGIWYFQANTKNKTGWGKIANYKIQIDSEKPELQVSEVAQDDPAATNFKFNLIASDKASGLAKIETSLDEGDFIIWQDNGSHIYVTATATTGKHILNVKATDNAGNTITQSTEFTIADLIAPYITEYPKNTIQGKTEYPNEVITVWLQKDLGEMKQYNVKSNSKGNFYLLTENKLAEGRYALWANVKKTDGTESPSSEKVYFEIKYPQQNTLDNILNTIKNNWFINIPLLGIGLLIILGLLFIRSRHKPQVKIVETKNTPSKIDSEDVDNIFKYLRSEVAQAFKILDKSKTKLEHKKNQAIALKKIQKDLTSAEKFIIEKCIKKK